MAGEGDRPRDVALGLLGVGNIGRVHLESALAMDGATLRAAADARDAGRAYADERGVPAVYGDYESLLRSEELDAVVVALPPFLHLDAVRVAAERGCHVFVEKPLARSVPEARSMLERAERAGISVGVDHTLRYLPGVRDLREAYREGRIGHVPYAHIARVNYGPFQRPPATRGPAEWHLEPELTGGGALVELGVHLLDVVEWTFGEVSVRTADLDRQLELPAEDAATLLCRAEETGTRVALHCGSYQWEDLSEFNLSYRLEGTTGSLDYDEFAPASFYANAAREGLLNVARRLVGRRPEYLAPTYYLRAYYDALSAFVEAVRADEPPPVDGTDGLRTLELVHEAYDAAASDPPVRERAA